MTSCAIAAVLFAGQGFSWPGGSLWGLADRLPMPESGLIAFELDLQDERGVSCPSFTVPSPVTRERLISRAAVAGGLDRRIEPEWIAFRRDSLPSWLAPKGLTRGPSRTFDGVQLRVNGDRVFGKATSFRALRMREALTMDLGLSQVDRVLLDHAVGVRISSKGVEKRTFWEAVAFAIGARLGGTPGAWTLRVEPAVFRSRLTALSVRVERRLELSVASRALADFKLQNAQGERIYKLGRRAIPMMTDAEVSRVANLEDVWVRKFQQPASDPLVTSFYDLKRLQANRAGRGSSEAESMMRLVKVGDPIQVVFRGTTPTLLSRSTDGGSVWWEPSVRL